MAGRNGAVGEAVPEVLGAVLGAVLGKAVGEALAEAAASGHVDCRGPDALPQPPYEM